MGKTYDHIPEHLSEWAACQEVFWVATAPTDVTKKINISPKGIRGSLHIVDKNTVWYEDLTGSGIETVAHLRENGRITVLFNAFEGTPRVLRFFGTGIVHEIGTPEYDRYLPAGVRQPASRAAIVINVYDVRTSCGWSVPLYTYAGPRDTLTNFGIKLERNDPSNKFNLKGYWGRKNLESIDGLPGLKPETTKIAVVPRARETTIVAGVRKQEPAETKVETKLPGGLRGEIVRIVLAFIAGLLVSATMSRLHIVAQGVFLSI